MIDFLVNNYTQILAIIGSIVTLATMITALTPTKRDDEIVSKVRKVLEFVSLRLSK